MREKERGRGLTGRGRDSRNAPRESISPSSLSLFAFYKTYNIEEPPNSRRRRKRRRRSALSAFGRIALFPTSGAENDISRRRFILFSFFTPSPFLALSHNGSSQLDAEEAAFPRSSRAIFPREKSRVIFGLMLQSSTLNTPGKGRRRVGLTALQIATAKFETYEEFCSLARLTIVESLLAATRMLLLLPPTVVDTDSR